MFRGLTLEGHHKPIGTIPCDSNMRRVCLGFHQLSVYSNLHTIVSLLCPIVCHMSSCTDTVTVTCIQFDLGSVQIFVFLTPTVSDFEYLKQQKLLSSL